MRFAQPLWLLVGALVVGLLFLLRARGESLTGRAMAALAGARLVHVGAVPSRFRRWLRVAVACVTVAMGFVALARPQKGMQWETLDRQGTDLLLVVDTSKSMNADDVAPTRLERTKLAVRDLVERFPGDRIGLVAFAGDAFVESPMTLDHDALLQTLGAFDTSIIGRGGTDIGRAIDTAAAALKAESGDQKVMVLLTDGEDLESQGLDAAKRAAEAGITIDTVGVGTAAGELVPAKDDQGATVGLTRDENGAPVRSRLDEAGLRAIAQATHGTYQPLGEDGRGLDRLYAQALAPLSHTERGARVRRVYAEWFAVPLALSIFGLVFDSLLGWRPRAGTRTNRAAGGSHPARFAMVAAVALALLVPAGAHASVQDAEKAYAAGHFEAAAREYEAERARHPKDARLSIDEGAAAYRAGHYDAAEAAYGRALGAVDPKLQERILYDLGDARYRLGATTLAGAPEKTIEQWKSAIAAYEGALALAPADKDATFNRDFVKGKLAELENKQKEQKDQKDPSPQNSPKKDGGDPNGKKDATGTNGGSNDASSGSSGGTKANPKPGDNGSPSSPTQATSGPPQDSPAAPGAKPAQGAATPGAADSADGHDRDAAKRAGQSAPDQAGRPEEGDPSAGRNGKLSARDARALLDSLRGDEHRGAAFGTSSAPPGTDSPRKDW
jgi:Ca-activated chloride channel family protein